MCAGFSYIVSARFNEIIHNSLDAVQKISPAEIYTCRLWHMHVVAVQAQRTEECTGSNTTGRLINIYFNTTNRSEVYNSLPWKTDCKEWRTLNCGPQFGFKIIFYWWFKNKDGCRPNRLMYSYIKTSNRSALFCYKSSGTYSIYVKLNKEHWLT